jgi:histidine decarboxylase
MVYKYLLTNNDKKRLDKLFYKLQHASRNYSGYPSSLNFDYSELFRFLSMNINNIGDPFASSNYHVNTHEIEAEVIEFFAELFGLRERHTGYVTNGGTEGNLYGLHIGSYYYPHGVVYYSESSHYSIDKIMRIIGVKNIKIKQKINGEMDYDDLYVNLNKNRHVPAIFLVNIGTTMTGAIDNLDIIKKYLHDLKIKDFYIHCDAALHGSFLPFVPDPPPFDFKAGIDSITLSGHKFIGSPIPCGIALVKYRYLKNLTPKISYIQITDSTISGSRNGMTPLFLWYAIKRFGISGFQEMTERCLAIARILTQKMVALGIKAWQNPYSNIVVFPCPSEKFVHKWQIATCDEIAHFIVMPHHSEEFFDHILKDLVSDIAFKKA